VNLVQEQEGQDFTDPWDRAQAVEGLRIVCFGRLDEIDLQVGQQAVLMADQGQVHLDALLDGGIRKPFGYAVSVRRISRLLAELRQVVLAVGILDMGQELCPLETDPLVTSFQSSPRLAREVGRADFDIQGGTSNVPMAQLYMAGFSWRGASTAIGGTRFP